METTTAVPGGSQKPEPIKKQLQNEDIVESFREREAERLSSEFSRLEAERDAEIEKTMGKVLQGWVSSGSDWRGEIWRKYDPQFSELRRKQQVFPQLKSLEEIGEYSGGLTDDAIDDLAQRVVDRGKTHPARIQQAKAEQAIEDKAAAIRANAVAELQKQFPYVELNDHQIDDYVKRHFKTEMDALVVQFERNRSGFNSDPKQKEMYKAFKSEMLKARGNTAWLDNITNKYREIGLLDLVIREDK